MEILDKFSSKLFSIHNRKLLVIILENIQVLS